MNIIYETDSELWSSIEKFNQYISNNDIMEASELAKEEIIQNCFDKDKLHEIGLKLWHAGKSHQSKEFFLKSFDLGNREIQFTRDYFGLLTGEMDYQQIFKLVKSISNSSLKDDDYINMLIGHANLAKQFDRKKIIEYSNTRECGAKWLDTSKTIAFIQSSIKSKKPSSFIRLGDGEARFVIYCEEFFSEKPLIEKEYSRLIANNIWNNWFGQNVPDSKEEIIKLYNSYVKSVQSADIVGITDSLRFSRDTAHFGYLAYQDIWIDSQISENVFFCDALMHYKIDKISNFLACFLDGIDNISVVSPHSELAERVSTFFSIKNYYSYVIPGERRLPKSYFEGSINAHFPDAFEILSKNIEVKNRGDLFIVAAGLLGKIYCSIIKNKGGIAIDVGSIVDGWMGINTRPGFLNDAKSLPELIR